MATKPVWLNKLTLTREKNIQNFANVIPACIKPNLRIMKWINLKIYSHINVAKRGKYKGPCLKFYEGPGRNCTQKGKRKAENIIEIG